MLGHRSRRAFLLASAPAVLLGEDTLEVAYAGSMASVMEGAIQGAALRGLGLTIRGRAQGANGLAQLIAAESIRPDVFISVTAGPMDKVRQANKAGQPVAIGRTEMVIAYDPKSRFAPQLQSNPAQWWRVLEDPEIRFGRTDPITDPQGRNILFVMQLASDFYRQPNLKTRILGADINPRQIFTEPTVQARLQSGQLDAASAYKVQPAAFHLPYLALPEAINLGSTRQTAAYARAAVTLNGRTYHPEPLVYYAAALTTAANASGAVRFVEWLRGPAAQQILRRSGYDPA